MKSTLKVLKALLNENRFRVVVVLMTHEELCVYQITGMLNIAMADVLRHMNILQAAHQAQSCKDGWWVYCRIAYTFPDILRKWISVVSCVFRGEKRDDCGRRTRTFKAVDERGGSPTGGIPQHRRQNRSGDSGRSVGERPLNGEGCVAFRSRCGAVVAAVLSAMRAKVLALDIVF